MAVPHNAPEGLCQVLDQLVLLLLINLRAFRLFEKPYHLRQVLVHVLEATLEQISWRVEFDFGLSAACALVLQFWRLAVSLHVLMCLLRDFQFQARLDLAIRAVWIYTWFHRHLYFFLPFGRFRFFFLFWIAVNGILLDHLVEYNLLHSLLLWRLKSMLLHLFGCSVTVLSFKHIGHHFVALLKALLDQILTIIFVVHAGRPRRWL